MKGKTKTVYVKKAEKKPLSEKQVKAVAKIAKKVQEKVIEHKQYSYSIGFSPVFNSTGRIMSDMLTVPQNVGDTARLGDELYLRGIRVRMLFRNNFGANSQEFLVWRIIVFQYKSQDNNPSEAELLNTSIANEGGVVGSFSSFNVDYKGVYHVLYDKIVTTSGTHGVANTGDADSPSGFKYHEFSVPLKYAKRKIQFENGSVSTVNGMFMYITTDRAASANNPVVKYQVQVNYTDS